MASGGGAITVDPAGPIENTAQVGLNTGPNSTMIVAGPEIRIHQALDALHQMARGFNP